MSQVPHIRITRLKVKNFKSLADVDVSLDSLIVLVGRNASGKSNFLDALAFVRDALAVDLRIAIERRGGLGQVFSLNAPGDAIISFGISLSGQGFTCEYEFGFDADASLQLQTRFERCSVIQNNEEIFGYERINGEGFTLMPLATFFPTWLHENDGLVLTHFARMNFASVGAIISFLREMRFYDPVPEAMRTAPRAELRGNPGHHLLESDGRNIGLALSTLLREQPNLFITRVSEPLRLVLPEITEIAVRNIESYWFTRLQRSEGKDSPDLWQESHGTLRLLATLVALVPVASSQSLVALEEPEDGVHPAAAAVLADAIVEASFSHQIVITTHSPDLLDHFPAESIRVVEQVEGWTRVGPLAGDQLDTIRRHLFHAGELMRMEGLRMLEERPPEQAV